MDVGLDCICTYWNIARPPSYAVFRESDISLISSPIVHSCLTTPPFTSFAPHSLAQRRRASTCLHPVRGFTLLHLLCWLAQLPWARAEWECEQVSAAEVVHLPISFLLPPHPLTLAVLLSLVRPSIESHIRHDDLLEAMLIALNTLCQFDSTAATAAPQCQPDFSMMLFPHLHVQIRPGSIRTYLLCHQTMSRACQLASAFDPRVLH